jgi:hypothetical protein
MEDLVFTGALVLWLIVGCFMAANHDNRIQALERRVQACEAAR